MGLQLLLPVLTQASRSKWVPTKYPGEFGGPRREWLADLDPQDNGARGVDASRPGRGECAPLCRNASRGAVRSMKCALRATIPDSLQLRHCAARLAFVHTCLHHVRLKANRPAAPPPPAHITQFLTFFSPQILSAFLVCCPRHLARSRSPLASGWASCHPATPPAGRLLSSAAGPARARDSNGTAPLHCRCLAKLSGKYSQFLAARMRPLYPRAEQVDATVRVVACASVRIDAVSGWRRDDSPPRAPLKLWM